MSSYQTPKYDLQKLKVLVELRQEAGLSQREVAEFFNMTDYNSVAAWEAGSSKPHSTRRPQFIIYLVDKLGLRRDHQEFYQIWNDIMVEEWAWEPLSIDELWSVFPSYIPPALSLSPQYSPYVEYSPDQQTELAQLDRLLADLRAMIYRLLDT